MNTLAQTGCGLRETHDDDRSREIGGNLLRKATMNVAHDGWTSGQMAPENLGNKKESALRILASCEVT